MNKTKRIKLLEHEIDAATQDYQHTHDTLWKMLQLLCDEFGMTLSIKPKAPDDAFINQLIAALNIADQRIPHSQAHDDAMEDVWELVDEYQGGRE
jgi:hypothetical protein